MRRCLFLYDKLSYAPDLFGTSSRALPSILNLASSMLRGLMCGMLAKGAVACASHPSMPDLLALHDGESDSSARGCVQPLTSLYSQQVLVTEKEPIQALKEVDVLAKLTPRMECLADLGPVTEPSMTQQLCKAFQEAAIPNRIQPYR